MGCLKLHITEYPDLKVSFRKEALTSKKSDLEARKYYPFGMVMQTYSPTDYRYGFNGQEKETELNSSITSAEHWFYDGRLGRRWNVDPVVKPWEGGYACFGNNPIYYADPDGLNKEPKNHTVQQGETLGGLSKKYNISIGEIKKANTQIDWKSVKRTGTKLNWIYAGETLKIPAPSSPIQSAQTKVEEKKTVYKDKSGDVILEITGTKDNKTITLNGEVSGLKEIVKSSDNKRPDADGFLTKEEADEWYLNANGKPLFVDVSKIDLPDISTKDFAASKVIYENFIWDLDGIGVNETGRVYGTLRLELINSTTGEVKIGGANYLDKYDFNFDGRLLRDFATYVGSPDNYGAGFGERGKRMGTGFYIYGYGTTTVPVVK